jgi:hypothetical protein
MRRGEASAVAAPHCDARESPVGDWSGTTQKATV